MKTHAVCLAVLLAFLFVVQAASAPFGYLSCSLRTSAGWHVLEIDVTAATVRTQASASASAKFDGIDAPPFFGDPSVIQRGATRDIALLNGDGSVTQIVAAAAAHGTNADPCISRDGLYVAYVQRDASGYGEDILHYRRENGLFDSGIYTTDLADVTIDRPRFLPDGKSVLFAVEDHVTGSQALYRVGINGGAAVKIAGLPPDPRQPACSPDGRFIACVADYGGTPSLRLAAPDGSNARRIDLQGMFALYPAFSPDGLYVAVCADNGIAILDIATTSVVRMIELDYLEYAGLCWHLGSVENLGITRKLKLKKGRLSLKALVAAPPALPSQGAVWIDRAVVTLDTPGLWVDKRGKKYLYKDPALKRTAKLLPAKEIAVVNAKKLPFVPGEDYRLNEIIPVFMNVGRMTFHEQLELNGKGIYKRAH